MVRVEKIWHSIMTSFHWKFIWCVAIILIDVGAVVAVTDQKLFLKRAKRFLIFEKGASMFIQGNIAKAIISGKPRGLNEISEYTLSYDLPWNIDALKKESTKKFTVTTQAPRARNTTLGWNYGTQASFDNVKTARCPNKHIFRKYYDVKNGNSYALCFPHKSKYVKKRRERNSSEQVAPSGSTLLFDLITHLAEMHGLNARHCIMRCLCESQHLLFPPGQLLFHDLVRILLSHAQPATQRYAPFRAAIHRKNLQECMKLYGLHCRWSFLQHFTESIAAAAATAATSH